MNILQSIKRGLKTTDKLLLLLCLIASFFGVLMVYSATYSKLEDGEIISRTALVMLFAILVGVVLCIVISFIDYELVLRFWMIIGGVCLIMMLLLFPFGSAPPDRPDAKTWFDLKFINFQPSELFKIAFIITFSVHLDYVGEDINKLKNALLLCLHGAVPALIVILTGDLGSALVFVSIFIGMMFASGLAARYFAAAAALIVAAVPILWFGFFSDFQKGRILAIYAPQKLDETLYKKYIFQQQQSVNAIGSGRLFGRGFLKGAYTQSHSVPVNDSDMVFSVIGEEFGFVGAFAALALIALVIIKIVFVGRKANTNMGSLLCYGTATMIGSQAIINIGMCLKLLPCIGITLPFFSSGGSSNLCIYIAIGLVLSVYRCSQRGEINNFRYSRISTPFN
ncbi:MAG: FtsW/RodA/SpoVE family cell cycle protein [Acutalibacteraceae bacterium]